MMTNGNAGLTSRCWSREAMDSGVRRNDGGDRDDSRRVMTDEMALRWRALVGGGRLPQLAHVPTPPRSVADCCLVSG